MKTCSKCDEKYLAKGYCQKHYNQKRYNKEYELAKYHKNKKKISKQRKLRYIKNREKVLKKCKKYYKNNKERYVQYAKNHPEIALKSLKKQLTKIGKQFDMTSMQYLYALQSWSKTIKKLDNFMCKNCSSKKNLNAHHIMPKSKYPELSLDLDNGITLCEDCHGEMHGYSIYTKS